MCHFGYDVLSEKEYEKPISTGIGYKWSSLEPQSNRYIKRISEQKRIRDCHLKNCPHTDIEQFTGVCIFDFEDQVLITFNIIDTILYFDLTARKVHISDYNKISLDSVDLLIAKSPKPSMLKEYFELVKRPQLKMNIGRYLLRTV
jgi:hypothetical protein